MKISKDNSKIIHASSVEINGKGVVILGKSGAGKSSLAIKLISMGAKLISFVKITNLELKRLPNAKKKYCFGKKIKMMEFNPFYNNESALFMSLRYGVKHNTI